MSGGSAVFSGTRLQSTFAAWCAVLALAEDKGQLLDALGNVRIERVGAEQDWPLDDGALWLSMDTRAFIQVKETLDASDQENSKFAEVWSQIARQSVHGRGRIAKVEPLREEDRLLIVVGEGTGRPVRIHLRELLNRLATHPTGDSLISVAQGQADLARQLTLATDHLRRFLKDDGYPSSDADIRAILKRCRVLPVLQDDLRLRGRMFLSTAVLEMGLNDALAFESLETLFASAGQHRTSYDVAAIRKHLGDREYRLKSPKAIKADVDAININTTRLLNRKSWPIKASEGEIVVAREIVPRIIAMARHLNVAITSQGGGGKSAVMLQIAKSLRDIGERVVFLDATAIDAMDIASSLRLEHRFEEVLTRWSEDGRISFLLIDGFDALRLGRSADTLLATLENLAANATRWHAIVASREYDLESFPRMARAFPPSPDADVCPGARTDARFSAISHAIIGDFSPAELEYIFSQSPSLALAYERADEALRGVLRNPFNLSIAAGIIAAGADFTTVKGRLDLLDLWWRHKIDLIDRFERQAQLRQITSTMIQARRLQIPVAGLANTSKLAALLSDSVIATVGRDGDEVAFLHALLFDYCAYRASLTTQENVLELLQRDRDAFIFVLPSLRYRFESLWDRNRDGFFKLIAAIFSDQNTQRLALLVLASRVIIERAEHVDDLTPLLTRNDFPTQRTVRYLIRALIRSRQLGERYILARARVFAPFALELAKRDREFHHEALLILSELSEHVETTREDSSVVEASRYLLDSIIGDENVEPRLRSMAIDAFLRTYDGDPTNNWPVLRRLLDPKRLAKFGPYDLNAIGYHFHYVKSLQARDLAFQVIFSKIIFQDGQVSMGGRSSLFGLSQDASQPLRSAQWAFAEMYPAVVEASADVAVRALTAALNEGNRFRRTGAHKFKIAGVNRAFSLDSDTVGEGSYAVDEWRRMLDSFSEKLIASLSSENRSYAEAILREATVSPIPTTFLRLLLRSAGYDAKLAEDLVTVVVKASVLRSFDLSAAVADYLGVALPIISQRSRKRIESALSKLVTDVADPPKMRFLNERLAMYLASIPDGILTDPTLVTKRRDILGETIDEQRRSLALHGAYIGSATMREMTISDGVDDPLVKPYLDEANAIMQHQAPSPAPDRLLPLARVLDILLVTLSGEIREQVLDIAIALVEYSLTRKHAQPIDVRDFAGLISTAAAGQHPITAMTDVEDERTHWGWPNARILAAQVLGHLGSEGAEQDRALLRVLAEDSSPQVRGRAVESAIGWARSDPDFSWEIIENALADRSPSVVHSAIMVAGQIASLDPNRYAALERQLYDRLAVERPSSQLTADLQRNLLWRALSGDGEAELRLDLLERPWEDQTRGQRLTLNLVNLIAHESAAMRVAARDRLVVLIDAIIDHILSEATADGIDQDMAFNLLDSSKASHSTRLASAKLLIEIAQRLYFDSGAYEATDGGSSHTNPGMSFEEAKYELIRPLVERLSPIPYSQISYNMLKILRASIALAPSTVLGLIDTVIAAGRSDNLASEQLAQQEAAEVVREYIEHYRGLLTADRAALRIIMDTIDTFADVGWPEWIDLVFTIDSIYRD